MTGAIRLVRSAARCWHVEAETLVPPDEGTAVCICGRTVQVTKRMDWREVMPGGRARFCGECFRSIPLYGPDDRLEGFEPLPNLPPGQDVD